MTGNTEDAALNEAVKKLESQLEEALATGDEEVYLRLELPSCIASSLARGLKRVLAAREAGVALSRDDLMRLFRDAAQRLDEGRWARELLVRWLIHSFFFFRNARALRFCHVAGGSDAWSGTRWTEG